MVKLRVKYHADIDEIKAAHEGEWIDLRCAENTEMRFCEYRNISLGVSIELPKGYEAIIIPRSSTFKKYGILLANSTGLIDNAYCGDNDIWQFPAVCLRNTTFIPKNERICQFRIQKIQPDLEIETVSVLGNADRGGLGSTGTV
mgnify:CR=1 FL=1